MLILNSGGTFNKKYNPIDGSLEVLYNNDVIEEILRSSVKKYNIAGVVYKDSLEMTNDDRKMIANIIAHSDEKEFIIVHGTDTMSETAEFLDTVFDDRVIVLVGSMKPYDIDKVEASLNLGMALGYIQAEKKSGIYICMSGYIEPWHKLVKNKEQGKFEIV